MTLKLHINQLLPENLNKVKDLIEGARMKLKDIKFMDLLVENPDAEKVRGMDFGVYLFFNSDGQCAYVGMTMDGFAKRMGQHFYTRRRGWPLDKSNQYLEGTLINQRGKDKREPADYSGMARDMGDHSLVMINAYYWDGVKHALKEAGVGKPEKFEGLIRRGREVWGAQKFCESLEKTLQAIYCPGPKDDSDHWLVKKPKENELHGINERIMEEKSGKSFAQLIMLIKR